jgi:hypothetical protein
MVLTLAAGVHHPHLPPSRPRRPPPLRLPLSRPQPQPQGLPHAQDDDRHVVGLVLADLARRDWIAKAGKEAQADLWDGLPAIEHGGGRCQNDRRDPAKGG